MSFPHDVDRFLDDPPAYFGDSYHAMHHLPAGELAALQLAGVRTRLAELRDRIPVLASMAAEQGIEQLNTVDDLVPLLFQHTMYKSYPVALLERNRFDHLTRWLDRLTTHDLSGVSVDGCAGIDDWLAALEEQTELRPAHSSGTTGTMSFLPRSTHEWAVLLRGARCGLSQFAGPDDTVDPGDTDFDIVIPGFRYGRSAMNRMPGFYVEHWFGGSEERLHVVHQGRVSADAMFIAARLRAAEARGELHRITLNPALAARREEFEAAQAEFAEGLPRFFERTIAELAGKRVWLFGTWVLLHQVADSALAQGIDKVFGPGSLVTAGGGAKGHVLPDDWEDKVQRFAGVDRIQHTYGMTETTAINKSCAHRRFHYEPWIVPYLLDPDDGRPLPREGVQTGRAAFFDLAAATYWGGFISGDEVSIDWSPCGCRQTTPHAGMHIERYSEKRGGDDKISCSASDEAHRVALGFLNDRLVP